MKKLTRACLLQAACTVLSAAIIWSALFFVSLRLSAHAETGSPARNLGCTESQAVAATICRDEQYPSSKCKCGPHGEIRWAKCTISKDPSTGKVCRGPWCQSCYTVCKKSAKAYRLYRERSQMFDVRRESRRRELSAVRLKWKIATNLLRIQLRRYFYET